MLCVCCIADSRHYEEVIVIASLEREQISRLGTARLEVVLYVDEGKGACFGR